MPIDDTLVATVKVTPDGHVVLPKEMREVLATGPTGDVTLVCKDNQIVMMHPVLHAMSVLQEGMKGEFEKAGLYTDDDVMELVKEIRYGIEGIPYTPPPQAARTADTVEQAAV